MTLRLRDFKKGSIQRKRIKDRVGISILIIISKLISHKSCKLVLKNSLCSTHTNKKTKTQKFT